MDEIRAKLLETLASCGVGPDLKGLSSMDVIHLAVSVERAFGIRFSLTEMDEKLFSSPDLLVPLIAEKLGKKR